MFKPRLAEVGRGPCRSRSGPVQKYVRAFAKVGWAAYQSRFSRRCISFLSTNRARAKLVKRARKTQYQPTPAMSSRPRRSKFGSLGGPLFSRDSLRFGQLLPSVWPVTPFGFGRVRSQPRPLHTCAPPLADVSRRPGAFRIALFRPLGASPSPARWVLDAGIWPRLHIGAVLMQPFSSFCAAPGPLALPILPALVANFTGFWKSKQKNEFTIFAFFQ